MYKVLLILILFVLIVNFCSELSIENFNNKNIIDKIYVINLKKDINRFNYIKNLASNASLNINRYDAIYGKTVSKDDPYLNNYISKNNKLSDPQKGCALSHIKLWDNIKKSNDNIIMILEDDVIIPQNFLYMFNQYIKELPNDWEMILLGSNTIIGKIYSPHFLHLTKKTKKNGNYGTFAYIIKKPTAEKLLNTCLKLDKTIDHHLNKNFYHNHKVFFCNPQLIKHNYNFISNITNKKRNGDELRNNKVKII